MGMPPDKTDGPLIGVGKDLSSKLVIQKSIPLLSLWRSSLTLPEFKILDLYLARIDSHKPDQRWVRLEKGELESLLGVERINLNTLKTRLKNLCIVVDVEDAMVPGGFRSVSLFEQMVCEPDEHGLWQVDLQCTQAAMRYIFNIENLGYLRYKLQSILRLKSRYSYILFLYCEQNRFRKTWRVSLEELKRILGCDQEVTYQEFKRFNIECREVPRLLTETHSASQCRRGMNRHKWPSKYACMSNMKLVLFLQW